MSEILHCHFDVIDWQENKIFQTEDGCSLARVEARYHYNKGIIGDSRLYMDLIYSIDGDSHFTGLEYIDAEINGKHGGLVLRHHGIHRANVASGLCELIIATGKLAGLQGTARYEASSMAVDLELTLI
ncbi:DUF3224 domain-containing protein [Gynuella sunshinyii]|uniref:DUF3224 domain-containing protein n=1 Tax=Gynuella sunshinyii YC6258 TaxID=1445510 RepID=A0A0C5VEJ1_9GAMM|nr:DUF3224 domain-containing protein [Gynuella sunshinyii]AJQ92977.1 hypothetical Protein YC6258_00927 [Gynuella sunshinyii YC6258]